MNTYYDKMYGLTDWDPFLDSDNTTLTPAATLRIKRDLMSLFTDPPFGLFVVGDESNIQIVHAIIVGVMDTPYEGGFFYFILKFPSDYPLRPPKVKLMTTDGGRVRFNPNMYKNGMICLSILGTWNGPAWKPIQQLSSLLLAIQSLMNDKPYFNEPDLLKELVPGDSERYTEMVRHETLRVAVCGMLENECHMNIPTELCNIMEKMFLQFYDQYVETVNEKMHLDGEPMIDPFTKKQQFTFQYKRILERLQALHEKLSRKTAGSSSDVSSISSEEGITIEN